MSGPQVFGLLTVGSTAGLLLVCFILYAVLQRKRHLRCPNCGARFRAAASRTFFAARDGVAKRMTCPECGYFGYMDDCRDSEADQALEDPPPADDLEDASVAGSDRSSDEELR